MGPLVRATHVMPNAIPRLVVPVARSSFTAPTFRRTNDLFFILKRHCLLNPSSSLKPACLFHIPCQQFCSPRQSTTLHATANAASESAKPSRRDPAPWLIPPKRFVYDVSSARLQELCPSLRPRRILKLASPQLLSITAHLSETAPQCAGR